MTQILIVDDDRSLLKVIQHGIETQFAAFTVVTAENGLQAKGLLKDRNIRLIVTDLRMPQMNGFELLAHVMERYPDIPVIVTTGHTIPDAQRAALKEQALRVMFKPFAMKALNDAIAHVLAKQTDGGTLFNVSPAMFLQLIGMEQKTCTVRIQEKNSSNLGVLFFRKGKLLNARTSDLQGEPAILEILSWDHLSLSIQNDCITQENKINRGLNALILEASRRKDERENVQGRNSMANRSTNMVAGAPEPTPEAENQRKSVQLDELSNRLRSIPGLEEHLIKLNYDERWRDLLAQILRVSEVLEAGKLRIIGIGTGQSDDLLIVPTNPPAVLTVDSRCSKEKIYEALQKTT